MARKPTVKTQASEDIAADSSMDLDKAIDDLRGALKADEDGGVLPGDAASFESSAGGLGDFGSSDFGSSDFGTSDFGSADLATNDFGSADLGSGDFGSSDFGGASFGGSFADASAPSLGADEAEDDYGLTANHDLIMDIPIDVQIVLGSSRMPVKGLMSLKEGTTITLDKKIGEPVDITVNGRLIARGEITLLEHDDTRFGVKLIELLGASKG